jgi:RNA polymerase sigma-70 factor (ECF subfamily)
MASRDDERFRALVKEHAPMLTGYFRRRLYPLGTGDLDDLVEETLIIAWRHVERIPDDTPGAYLVGIARNVLRNAQRSARRRSKYEGQVRPATSMGSAEDVVVGDEAVRSALGSLGDADREILTLVAWEGLELVDLARIFSITTNAAGVRLSRAQQRFRDALEAFDATDGKNS